jgi:hypothetical protein
VIMPTPVKRKVASSAGNVSVPTGGKNEVDGGETESLGLTPKSNDSVVASKRKTAAESGEAAALNRLSTPRAAKTVAKARIH